MKPKNRKAKQFETTGLKIKQQLSRSTGSMREINAAENSSLVKGKKPVFKAHAKLGPGGEIKTSHSSVK